VETTHALLQSLPSLRGLLESDVQAGPLAEYTAAQSTSTWLETPDFA